MRCVPACDLVEAGAGRKPQRRGGGIDVIQIIGSVLLFGTCTALGFGAGFRLKERVKELSFLVVALEEMERELQCRLTPLPELLSTLSNHLDGPVGVFFRLCVSGLNGLGERSFSSLWREALEAADPAPGGGGQGPVGGIGKQLRALRRSQTM